MASGLRDRARGIDVARGVRAIAGLAGLAALGGCADDTGTRELAEGDEYVALGDSYTAAYLTGETDPASGKCFRSLENYPRRIAAALGLELTDVSCGGATTESVRGAQAFLDGTSVPPQLDAVSDTTDLVTLRIGANDFNIYGAIVVNCVQLAPSDPDGAPCTEASEQQAEEVATRFELLRQRLVAVLAAVRERAPEARVVVVGYPQVFPEQGPCDAIRLAAGDYSLARDYNRRFTDALATAAAEAEVTYVDMWEASAGHDMCAADPWIAGRLPTGGATAYHPYAQEQAQVADLVVDTLRD